MFNKLYGILLIMTRVDYQRSKPGGIINSCSVSYRFEQGRGSTWTKYILIGQNHRVLFGSPQADRNRRQVLCDILKPDFKVRPYLQDGIVAVDWYPYG